MKFHPAQMIALGPGCALLLLVAVHSAGAAPAQPPATATSPANAGSFVALPIPQSVFVIPTTPKEGRNPFFPKVAVSPPIVIKSTSEGPKPLDLSGLVLDGIIPYGTRKSVMINGSTFESGEEHYIKLPSGERVRVKCEQIREGSAIVLVASQRQELRLRSDN